MGAFYSELFNERKSSSLLGEPELPINKPFLLLGLMGFGCALMTLILIYFARIEVRRELEVLGCKNEGSSISLLVISPQVVPATAIRLKGITLSGIAHLDEVDPVAQSCGPRLCHQVVAKTAAMPSRFANICEELKSIEVAVDRRRIFEFH